MYVYNYLCIIYIYIIHKCNDNTALCIREDSILSPPSLCPVTLSILMHLNHTILAYSSLA